jgi:hypothetical protein
MAVKMRIPQRHFPYRTSHKDVPGKWPPIMCEKEPGYFSLKDKFSELVGAVRGA